MRIVRTFCGLLLILFSLTGGVKAEEIHRSPSIKQLLLQLEEKIREGDTRESIELTVEEILRAKETYPVFHLPELNYLMKREVEKVPSSELTTVKELLFGLEPLKRAVETILFVLLFYTFVFYFQHIDADPGRKKAVTLGVVLLLATTVALNLWPLFFFLAGFGTLTALAIKKRRTALGLFLGSCCLIFFFGATENLADLVRSPQLLYNIKVSRDGYAPEYLVEKVLTGEGRELEVITSNLALGELDEAYRLNGIDARNPLLKGIVFNDWGYYYYMKGEFEKALENFEAARELIDSPVVLFNLYLTYSALLEVDRANEIKKELLAREINIPAALSTPLLVHVPPRDDVLKLPLIPVLFYILGLGFNIVFERIVGFYAENINPQILTIPGMKSFINSQFRPFVLVFFLVLVANFLLGRAVCSM